MIFHEVSLLKQQIIQHSLHVTFNYSWDSALLSTAGRAELIQSTISPNVLYWLLMYHVPTSINK